MSSTKVATRYAKSLLDLSIEQNKLEEVVSDIQGFMKMSELRDFKLLLKSPIVNTTKKLSIFKEIFEGKVSDLTMLFFKLILKKGREKDLLAIANSFVKQYKKMKGLSSVTITTAEKLSDENIESIKTKLLASNATDKAVEITSKIDPSIIGGYILEIGDKLYDASVLYKLKELRKEFSGSSYVKEI